MEKQYIISESVRNAVLNYLSIKPWNEVNQLINALISTEEVFVKDDNIKDDNIKE